MKLPNGKTRQKFDGGGHNPTPKAHNEDQRLTRREAAWALHQN